MKKKDFLIGSGRLAASPGVRRNVVQRRDSTEERAYHRLPFTPDLEPWGFSVGVGVPHSS